MNIGEVEENDDRDRNEDDSFSGTLHQGRPREGIKVMQIRVWQIDAD